MIGALATLLAIVIDSIYGLWYLCSDLVYVILFPQLVCVVYLPYANTYGSLVGYVVGMCLRLTGGEPLLGLPAAIRYPYYDAATQTQNFPFKTMTMLISLLLIVGVSWLTRWLFVSGRLPKSADVLRCVVNVADPTRGNSKDPPELETKASIENMAYLSESPLGEKRNHSTRL